MTTFSLTVTKLKVACCTALVAFPGNLIASGAPDTFDYACAVAQTIGSCIQ